MNNIFKFTGRVFVFFQREHHRKRIHVFVSSRAHTAFDVQRLGGSGYGYFPAGTFGQIYRPTDALTPGLIRPGIYVI